MPQPPALAPARFTPAYAVGYTSETGETNMVSAASPLPVAFSAAPPSVAAPLAGSASASSIVGPFAPTRGLPVVLSLEGSWTGTVSVRRSTNGGTSKLPLTVGGQAWGVFAANACEPVWEENDPAASLYLAFELTAGTVDYRLGH